MLLSTVFLAGCSKESDPVTTKINELYAEKRRISYNIDKCKNDLERLTVTKAGIFFLFEEMTPALLDIACPAFREKGDYIGIVEVSHEEISDTSILYSDLKGKGWEFAIGFEDGYTFPESDADAEKALRDYIALYGEDHPKVISFSSGSAKYRRSFDSILKEEGINVIIAPKLLLAGGSTYLEYDHEAELLKVSCTAFSMRNTVESIMRTSIGDKHPLALCVKQIENESLSAMSDNISLERFNLMLDFLEKYDDVFYGKAIDYKNSVAAEHDKNLDEYNEILERIHDYEIKIKEIEEEISTLMGDKL